MPERDWQTDMELARRFNEAGYSVRLFEQGNGLRGYSFMRKNGTFADEQLICDWFLTARKSWPAALEERARLEGRVRELETLLDRILTACADAGLGAASFSDDECRGLLQYIDQVWQSVQRQMRGEK